MQSKNGNKFWQVKSLDEMTPSEWESLCDGCGRCCLEKLEDPSTGKIKLTPVACEFLDIDICRCTIYETRLEQNPACIKLTPRTVEQKKWLPQTCAYRRLLEGKDLAWWHPLISGDPDTVHDSKVSVRNKVVSGRYVHPEDVVGIPF